MTEGLRTEKRRLELGQRVRYAATLRRAVEYAPLQRGQWTKRRRKVWKRGDWRGEPDPGEGIVVGLRRLSDGYADWISEEEGYGFSPTETHQAVLIAYSTRRRPVLALLEDVEPLPDPALEAINAALDEARQAEDQPALPGERRTSHRQGFTNL